ncbi:hypothetical protein [Micromonospora viridifaciens]|uniref:hypothetical protein n=1 Tax=Micromonospora viridifaciens TaxID=1881 RepID=UPI0012FDF4FB|nr:hypothetical protein [Micromonospora viridifaciens]
MKEVFIMESSNNSLDGKVAIVTGARFGVPGLGMVLLGPDGEVDRRVDGRQG